MRPYLPEQLPLNNLDYRQLIKMVGKANAELARYDGLLRTIINPEILLSAMTTREAVLSSKIEGTQATMDEVLRYEAGIPAVDERKVADIQEMTVGIMPLDDSEWARGKCSFKMILYMSCGIPVVVSRYGMNAEVLQQGEVGFGAVQPQDWVDALESLLASPERCARMGQTGRAVAELHYSVEVLAPRLANIPRGAS